jgi:hypothetical protein
MTVKRLRLPLPPPVGIWRVLSMVSLLSESVAMHLSGAAKRQEIDNTAS